MAVIISAYPLEILRRQVLGHPFGQHNRSVFAAFAFAGQHHVDHPINYTFQRHHGPRLGDGRDVHGGQRLPRSVHDATGQAQRLDAQPQLQVGGPDGIVVSPRTQAVEEARATTWSAAARALLSVIDA